MKNWVAWRLVFMIWSAMNEPMKLTIIPYTIMGMRASIRCSQVPSKGRNIEQHTMVISTQMSVRPMLTLLNFDTIAATMSVPPVELRCG